MKVFYNKVTNISDEYIDQTKTIQKLKEENIQLKKLLLEQSVYIDELSKIYKLIPSLAKKPYKNLYLVNTISYVKLNKLNEIILTTPKNFKFNEDKLYGLIQKDVAGGIAQYKDGKLYAYLLTNPKCTFSAAIGEENANGIAQGDGNNGIVVKFIPRWSKIKVGDKVRTSGLDNIFFPRIPVGVVTKIETLDAYKQATVRVFANLANPSLFFLISDPTPYLTTDYTPDTTFPGKVYPFVPIDKNDSEDSYASQTKDDLVIPFFDKERYNKDLFNLDLIWQNTTLEKTPQ
jgi:rod shape-determining protein MreC